MNPARQAAQRLRESLLGNTWTPHDTYAAENAIAAEFAPLLEKARLLASEVERVAPLYGFATMPAAQQARELLALLGEEK